ncbi:hypothetical protein ACFQVA_25075 [Actinomadura keratinilytica]
MNPQAEPVWGRPVRGTQLLGLRDSGFVVSSGPHRGELSSVEEVLPAGRGRTP